MAGERSLASFWLAARSLASRHAPSVGKFAGAVPAFATTVAAAGDDRADRHFAAQGAASASSSASAMKSGRFTRFPSDYLLAT